MNKINWRLVNPLLDKKIIELFEKENGITLPLDFKECIMENNAGYPSLDIVTTIDGLEIEINSLISYNKQDIDNIYNVFGFFKKEYNNTILPIFTTSSNDYICIDLLNQNVLYWQEQTGELIFISENFTAFLNRCYN